MRSSFFRYSILFFLGLAFILNACTFGADPPPAVTPDITMPSTLKVTVTINEDQDASDTKSVVTLSFSTNEIAEPNTVIFTHGESVNCNGITIGLGSAASYSVRMNIPPMYTCDYHLNNNSALIFSVPKRSHLSPVLHRPVGNNPFIVTYNPDSVEHRCALQGVATDAANNMVSGTVVASDGRTYTGDVVSSLNGAGNVKMTRTCMCPSTSNKNLDSGYDCPLSHGNTGDNNKYFDSVNLTYTSTASYEVTWVPPDTPATSTS